MRSPYLLIFTYFGFFTLTYLQEQNPLWWALFSELKQYLLLTAELRLLSVKDPRADNILMRERNALTDYPLPFLGIEQIDRWYEAKSFDQIFIKMRLI